jgi:hypothetical protein
MRLQLYLRVDVGVLEQTGEGTHCLLEEGERLLMLHLQLLYQLADVLLNGSSSWALNGSQQLLIDGRWWLVVHPTRVN